MSYRKHLVPNDIAPSEMYAATAVDSDTDTISRQAAKDMIKNHKSDFSTEKDYRTARACVNAVPSTQPQIIRCRDCRHFKQVFAPNDNDGLCGHWHSKCDARTSLEGYCSHAERKQNDTERC